MSASLLSAVAVALAVGALALAGTGLWLGFRARRRWRQTSELWSEQQAALEARIQLLEQRLLDLGDHVIAVERRANVTLEQSLLQRAGGDPDHAHDSEQAKRLRSVSARRETVPEADAEARLRALLARHNPDQGQK